MAKLGDDDKTATVTSSWEGGVPVIRIAGELDLASAGDIHQSVKAIIGDGPERVVFDLSMLEFMDSSGISLLLAVAERVPVEIRDASPIVRQLIEMTGLVDTLPLTP